MKKLLFLFCFSIAAAAFSQPTLVCHYDFTSGSTGDLSGNNYNGTFFGSPNTTGDRFGVPNNAMSFNGVGDYLSTPCPGVTGTTSRTITFWTNVVYGQAGGSILSYGGGGYGTDFTASFNIAAQNSFYMDWSDLAQNWADTINDGKWHQWAIVFDSNISTMLAGVSVYKDANLVTNIINTYNPGHWINTANFTTLTLGNGQYAMDDFKMYSGAFSALQIDSIFMAEAPQNPCLLSRYDFTGNANDGAGANHGTVSGATLTTDRYGNPNSAYSFNGTSDYIDIASGFPLAGNDFSIGFWAKRAVVDGNFHVVISQGPVSPNPGEGLHCGFTGTYGPPEAFVYDYMFDTQLATGTTYADSLSWNQWYVTYNNATKGIVV